ncbi:MAG: polyphosphate kinase 2 family protein [Acidimicrobiia bacterium]|nr:polyphosphate kinase 2 family protein [Acidimicrobiia bacterium]MBT8194080.1 polyphosphate kinase 2 family protein [Acidimicrobiia bacterium]NNF87083.1 polyphosphate kinase 2 family protein [Acidimicrobiia bacterium]NNL14798.1 polyphosphate kinase 2 family protein [Acidimicrobiia bacterium]NNL97195.1 polyphosphate kinase 2 family protein [Acidimicrobiia bacterium]
MEKYRVTPGATLRLADLDPADTGGIDKATAKAETKTLNRRLESQQELLYAEGKHKVLIVLQAMDAAGKDGTIRHVFDRVNPQGVKVASFKKPTSKELSHDYLWRVHEHTPATGEITIFNRSHYEDVLIVRVLGLVPEDRWQRRYGHIRAFEQLLADEGTTIRKFYLNISKEEQRARLQARLDDPSKHWKFDVGDLDQRKLWDDYMAAYETAMSETSTEDAPWYVIPAEHKWYRNLVISRILVDTFDRLNMAFPEQTEDLSGIVVE